jgi:hypothetical protein
MLNAATRHLCLFDPATPQSYLKPNGCGSAYCRIAYPPRRELALGRVCHQHGGLRSTEVQHKDLSGVNAGRSTCIGISIDFDSYFAEWLENLVLLRVDAPTTMQRGPALVSMLGAPKLHASATQALG